MLAEAFLRLSPFGAVSSYRYVGFGSPFFVDFRLFHRQLGIKSMVSIEKETGDRARFEFNRPYSHIELFFGHSNEVLPKLPWDVRTILWLDYDYELSASVFADIEFFCANAMPGSVIVLTVDVDTEEESDRSLNRLKDLVGRDRIPLGIKSRDLLGWGKAHVSRQILVDVINETLGDRNGRLNGSSKLKFNQLFNFEYRDTSRMLSMGGIITDLGQDHVLKACGFDLLQFVRTTAKPMRIRIPSLTFKEMRALDALLPARLADVKFKGLRRDDIREYAGIYRYFPAFADVEF